MPLQHKTQTKTSENDRSSQVNATAKSIAAPAMHPMLHLQQQVGNQAVWRLIQAKLTVGEPNDVYEQEADCVAAEVVRQIHTPQIASSRQSAAIQRQVMGNKEEELRRKPLIQCKSDVGGMAVSSEIESSIQQARGSGQPLAESIRKPMEHAFGADFSGVRVHTDDRSDRLNREVQALAFTTGQDVFFRQGAYQPGSSGGQQLLAHELTHVVQQGNYTENDKERINNEIYDFNMTESIKPKNLWLPKTRDNIQRMRVVIPCKTPKEDHECHVSASYMEDPAYGDYIAKPAGAAKFLNEGEVLHLISHGNANQFGKFNDISLANYIADDMGAKDNKYLKEIVLHGCESIDFAPKLQRILSLTLLNKSVVVYGIPGYTVTTKEGLEYYNDANKQTEDAIEEINIIEKAFYTGIDYAVKGEMTTGNPNTLLKNLMEYPEAKRLKSIGIMAAFNKGQEIGEQKKQKTPPEYKQLKNNFMHYLMEEYKFKSFRFVSNQSNNNNNLSNNNNNNLSNSIAITDNECLDNFDEWFKNDNFDEWFKKK
jgi:Domain of unknown function (DUF4157)